MSTYFVYDEDSDLVCLLNEQQAHALSRLLRRVLHDDARHDTNITLRDETLTLTVEGPRL